jgi:mannose-1-phosphate guanylyltransferase / mannose-6-phosphate isomerase
MSRNQSIVPVILSGGAGSRLWPLSRKLFPKQLLALAGPNTMFQETVARVRTEKFAPPIVISSQDHRFQIAEQLQALGISGAGIILEPVGRNTAPAAAIASLKVLEESPDSLLLLMPSDHVIRDVKAFHAAVDVAAEAAREGALVTFGVKPSAPETGYGYIKSAAPLSNIPGAFSVERFVEKPDKATADAYLASGQYFWNSGMFMFSAAAFIEEMERLEPAMLASCRDAMDQAHRDADFIRLDEGAFRSCKSQSIDYAIMEHASHAAVVPVDLGWSDVGSWQALWEIAPRNADGNVVIGRALAEKTSSSYIRSDGAFVAAVGVDNLVIIVTGDAVLVCPRDKSQDVKKIVEMLSVSDPRLI